MPRNKVPRRETRLPARSTTARVPGDRPRPDPGCAGESRAAKHAPASPRKAGKAPPRAPARDDAEVRLARRIRAWAQTWRRCPLKRCRRRGACSREDACCGVPPGPAVFTDAERMAIRRALDRFSAPRPLYDGDARERD